MMQKKTKRLAIFSFVLAFICLFPALSIYIYAAPLSATDRLLSEEPKAVYAAEDFDDVLAFYQASDTDTILEEKENNYTYGLVRVGGADRFCHVYMRTFSIQNVHSYTIAEANEAVQRLFAEIKAALSAKYIKCVAVHYTIATSGKRNNLLNRYDSLTIRFFICTNESNEERHRVIDRYVRPIVAEWLTLPENDRLVRLNEFMLDGKFRYDMNYVNRSSVAQFILDGVGLCEEYAALVSLFLDQLGYQNMLICGTANGVPHVWNLVCIRNRWYNLDVLWNGPIDAEGNHITVEVDYLLVSGEKMMQTHTVEPYFESIMAAAQYDYYFGAVPYDVDVTDYVKSGNFIIVPPETTCGALLSDILQERFVEIYRDGTRLSDEDTVGTGTRVVLQVNGLEICSYYVLTAGDLTGDGTVGKADLQRLEDHFLAIEPLEDITTLTAADLNGDGELTATDLLLLYRLVKQMHPDEFPEVTGTPTEPIAPQTQQPMGADTSDQPTGLPKTQAAAA